MAASFIDIMSNMSNKECSDYLFDYLKLKRYTKDQSAFKTAETFVCESMVNLVKTRKELSRPSELSWEEVQNMDRPTIPSEDENGALVYPSEIEQKQAKLIN